MKIILYHVFDGLPLEGALKTIVVITIFGETRRDGGTITATGAVGEAGN